jgi:hypothetical protein
MLPRMRSRFSVGSLLLVLALTGPPLNARVIEIASQRSLAKRYSNREDYLARYQKPVEDLVKQRWILQVDRTPLLHRAGAGMGRGHEIDLLNVGLAGVGLLLARVFRMSLFVIAAR